jgi:hypothetical protein
LRNCRVGCQAGPLAPVLPQFGNSRQMLKPEDLFMNIHFFDITAFISI